MKARKGGAYSIKHLIVAALGLSFSIQASAARITIDTSFNPLNPPADNQGWWSDGIANSNPTNDNYIAGSGPFSPEVRSYFSFDLGGLLGNVASAVFEVRRYNQTTDLTLGLFDVSTSIDQLTLRNVIRPDIFADLGTGNSYGQFEVLTGDTFDVLSFALNATALADINSVLGDGFFSIGAAVIGDGTIFATSNLEGSRGGPGYTQRLILTGDIPEPGTAALFGLGLVGVGLFRKNKLML